MGLASAALVLALGFWHPANAVRYNPGVFEQVAQNRHMPVVVCMASHPILALGTWIEVEGPAGTANARVTDTSAPADRQRHIETQRAEFSYDCARHICGQAWDGAAAECPIVWRIRR